METYKMNFATKTLTITKAFADAAADPSSDEYSLIQQFQKDIPNLTIKQRTHKTPSKYRTKQGEIYKCNPNKNLSYENMEAFISALSNSEEMMKVYNALRDSVGKVRPSTYQAVRDWFVEQFPYYRKSPLFYLYNEVKPIDITKFLTEKQDA